MKHLSKLSPLFIAILLVFTASAAAQQQVMPPEEPDPRPVEEPPRDHPVIQRNLTLTEMDVDVRVDGTLATTTIHQTLRNDTRRTVEGKFMVPLPAGASVSDFAILDGDRRLDPEMLPAEEARRIYRDIVRRAKDPGLMEYADRNTYRASVFPFEPDQTRTIEIEFTQNLTGGADLLTYSMPLGWAGWSQSPRGGTQFVLTYEVTSQNRLGTVGSPTHKISANRDGPNRVTGSLERSVASFGDSFTLHITRQPEGEFSANLLCYPDSSVDGGYFQLSLLAVPGDDYEPVPKDVVFVFDKSGSMDGKKIKQARGALQYVLGRLNSEDRFGLLYYSDLVQKHSEELLPASGDNVQQARDFVDTLEASGGTDINSALEEAAAMLRGSEERPAYVVFLTDGKPTVGVTRVERITRNAADNFRDRDRVFAFGVGYSVNTTLLDTLSNDHHGRPSYVTPDESIEARVSQFYSRIATPAMIDPELELAGLDTTDLMPRETPDLFYNTDIFLTGKYKGTPAEGVELTVSGQGAGGNNRTYNAELACRESPSGHQIPRLWASRKVNWLLDQVEMRGENEELIGEIERLATRYGIVTEYTSYLIRERPGETGEEAIAREMQDRSESGQQAVQRSKQSAESQSPFFGGPAAPGAGPGGGGAIGGGGGNSSAPERQIRQVLDLTFLSADDQGETRWVDSRLDEENHELVAVQTYSDSYFELIDDYPELEKVLSLGERVTVVLGDGLALATTPEETETSDADLQRVRDELDSGQILGATGAGAVPAAFQGDTTASSESDDGTTASESPETDGDDSGGLGWGTIAAGLLALGLVLFLAVRSQMRDEDEDGE